VIQDCLEKRSEEYKRWFESIPQQLKELKQKHEKERCINAVIQKSNNNIKKFTKWSPKYSSKEGFKKALIETYNWFSNKENLKNYSNFDKYNI